jgi:hypothetical protein
MTANSEKCCSWDSGCYNRPRLSPYTTKSNGARNATGVTMLERSLYTISSANPADHCGIAQSAAGMEQEADPTRHRGQAPH